MAGAGLLIAAPSSGAGKTVISLALMRALRRRGVAVRPAKSGPDYIDPSFHGIAAGRNSVNLDAWAMEASALRKLAGTEGLLIVEGAMGLFDGAAHGSGSAADVAAALGVPVILVVDAARASHSVAAIVRGFATHRGDVRVAGVIANRVGSDRHESMLRAALGALQRELGVELVGVVRRDRGLELPSRHLGLVPASEHADVDAFADRAADVIDKAVDWSILERIARTRDGGTDLADGKALLPPLGQRVAVARDTAFAFAYRHVLDGWRAAGCDIVPFSPLADESPDNAADAVFLPGGYPELHAARLASAASFAAGMRAAAARGAWVYGECGGYMVLGEGLVGGNGERHAMLGLLPTETSFAERRLHLGYRRATAIGTTPFGRHEYAAHEHHHAIAIREVGRAAFDASDACGEGRCQHGLRRDKVFGSFLHLIAGRAA